MKKTLLAVVSALTCTAFAQHTTPNTWTPLIGGAQGWPQSRSGRAIHMIHVPPTNLAMGNRGLSCFSDGMTTSKTPCALILGSHRCIGNLEQVPLGNQQVTHSTTKHSAVGTRSWKTAKS